jgi:tRNA G18 (ribose-2'-O)-methylase SpoU
VAPESAEALALLGESGFRRIGTASASGTDHRAADLTGDVAIVLGSEAHGVAAEADASLDERVTIPMRGHVESLNVAVAGAVLAYERVRQLDAGAGSGER